MDSSIVNSAAIKSKAPDSGREKQAAAELINCIVNKAVQ